ncbi:MAG TPA: 4-hydroxybutyrate CoA-transferase [Gammaproteobacteria bacterium]|nr:4-hydroxybutyrate CoA-transferase [Gammaproteobacteria bacterium]
MESEAASSSATLLNDQLSKKTITAEQVAALVNSGDVIEYGMSINQPDLFDRALAQRKQELRDVYIRGTLTVSPRQVVLADPEQQHFSYDNWHFSTWDRRQFDEHLVSYIPFNFGESPEIYRDHLHIDLLVIKTTTMDRHGYFNFGASNAMVRVACEIAQRVVVETSSALPRCYGIENAVHISEVDAVIVGDNQPPVELPSAPVSDIDRQVADYILREVDDGACLQIGIGGMPNAVCSALADSSIRDLGVHTEMFVDGMVDLAERGKLTGARKRTYRGKIAYSFALGSARCYDFIDQNEQCISLPVNETNLPENIARNANVVSINNAMQIDLSGQVCSESAGYAQRTGTGGQLQFVRGAFMSPGGKSFICLSSRFSRGDQSVSRIVPGVQPGTVVTTPRTDVMYVVTEYGIANLKGKSVAQRAQTLIGLAHPDDRDQLHQQARDAGMLNRRYW